MAEREPSRDGACAQVADALACYHYGELDPDEERVLELHLEGCERCRAELARLRALVAQLDRLPVPLPSAAEWSRLELELRGRVAAVRADRERGDARPRRGAAVRAWSRWVAVAAVLVSVGVAIWSERRVSAERSRVAVLLRQVGELSLELGDVGRAQRAFEALMVTAPHDRRLERQIEAVARLRGQQEAVALYRRARAAPPPRRRALLESLVLRFPDHPLAVEAFHALLARSRPRPLVLATLKPIPLVRAPSAGESRAVDHALEIGRLERIGAGSEPALAAFALYHAARLADRGGDAARARALWARVAQLPVEGPIVQRAREALGTGADNAGQRAEPRR